MTKPESLLVAISKAVPAMNWEIRAGGSIAGMPSFYCYGNESNLIRRFLKRLLWWRNGNDPSIMVQCTMYRRPGKEKFSGYISTARKFVPAIRSVIQTTENGNSEAPYYVISFNDDNAEFTAETVRLLFEGKVDSAGKFLS